MPKQTFFNLPDEKRSQIIALAVAEFADKSYAEASISKIVKQAGIAKGSFYQYFTNKRDLYLYLVNLAGEKKVAFMQQFQPPQPDMGTFDYLRWAFSVRIQFELSHPQWARLSYNAGYVDTAQPAGMRQQAEALADTFTQSMLARGSAGGDLRPDLDFELAAFIFNAVFLRLGDFVMQKLDVEPNTLLQDNNFLFLNPAAKEIFNGIMDILQHGMGKQEPADD